MSLCQGRDIRTASDEPLPVVGSFENLVDEKQDGRGRTFLSGIKDRLESFDFRIEKREAGIERIIDTDAAGQSDPGPVKAAGTDRSTGLCQAQVDPDRSQECT